MRKKLTITLDEMIYDGLHAVIGRRHISQFIERLVRPHVLLSERAAGYQLMAVDEAREQEAEQWSEALVADGGEATR